MDTHPPTEPGRIRTGLIKTGIALVALAISMGFVHQHIRFITHVFSGDWLQMQFYWEAPRQEILRFGQIPLWNRWGYETLGIAFNTVQLTNFAIIFLFLCVPTFLMGGQFPLVIKLIASNTFFPSFLFIL